MEVWDERRAGRLADEDWTCLETALGCSWGACNGVPPGRTVATGALALCYSSAAFAVGAATGNRSLALGIGSAVAVVRLAVENLAAQVPVLRPMRDVTSWQWLLNGNPLRRGWAPDIWVPPLPGQHRGDGGGAVLCQAI